MSNKKNEQHIHNEEKLNEKIAHNQERNRPQVVYIDQKSFYETMDGEIIALHNIDGITQNFVENETELTEELRRVQDKEKPYLVLINDNECAINQDDYNNIVTIWKSVGMYANADLLKSIINKDFS